ncbi:hypothetical protein Tco_0809879 [Tanacetum coccineum]
MGDENPIRTVGDYSKPSHEGYRNTINLPVGNNVVPLRFDNIRLVQNGCSFYGLRSEDPNQHLKDFLKLVDSLDLDNENRKRTRLQDLALYDNESWNDPRDFTKSVKAITLPQDVSSTSDRRLIDIENQVQRLMEAHLASTQPTQSLIEQNKNPSSLKRVHFVNSIVILNKEGEAKEESSMEAFKAEFMDHEMSEGREEVESEEEAKEETEDEAGEEEKEGNPKHFDTFPTMNELMYHEWLLKNPWPPWVKAKSRTGNVNIVKFSCMIGQFNKEQAYLDEESPINIMSRLHYNWIMSNRLELRKKPSNPTKNCNFIGRVRGLKVFVRNFTYECDFMVLKDTTSVIDHYLGSVVFGKPFIEEIGLVYNKEEGTVVFETDKERITFKMPHKMDMFKHIDFIKRGTDCNPPFIIESDDDNCEKTYY